MGRPGQLQDSSLSLSSSISTFTLSTSCQKLTAVPPHTLTRLQGTRCLSDVSKSGVILFPSGLVLQPPDGATDAGRQVAPPQDTGPASCSVRLRVQTQAARHPQPVGLQRWTDSAVNETVDRSRCVFVDSAFLCRGPRPILIAAYVLQSTLRAVVRLTYGVQIAVRAGVHSLCRNESRRSESVPTGRNCRVLKDLPGCPSGRHCAGIIEGVVWTAGVRSCSQDKP